MSHESDINYLIAGLFFGGVASSSIAFLLPNAEFGVRLGIAAFGCIAGIGISYLLAWTNNRIRRRRIARTLQRQADAAPPPMPNQIAGKACSSCSALIVFAADGSFCKVCHQPFCANCNELKPACASCLTKQQSC